MHRDAARRSPWLQSFARREMTFWCIWHSVLDTASCIGEKCVDNNIAVDEIAKELLCLHSWPHVKSLIAISEGKHIGEVESLWLPLPA
jgi:hypothetical protein